MVDSLGMLLSRIHCLDCLPLAIEIIHELNMLLEIGQYWVPHRQNDAVDNLGMVDILQGLLFQREVEEELQHFLSIDTGCC